MTSKLDQQKARVWLNIDELCQRYKRNHWDAWDNYLANGRKFTPLYAASLFCDLVKYGIEHEMGDYQIYLNSYHYRGQLKDLSIRKKVIIKDYLSDTYQKWFTVELKI